MDVSDDVVVRSVVVSSCPLYWLRLSTVLAPVVHSTSSVHSGFEYRAGLNFPTQKAEYKPVSPAPADASSVLPASAGAPAAWASPSLPA